MYYRKGCCYELFYQIDAGRKILAESYAKLHSLSLGEAFKKALFERIEDEYDITAANEAYEEYVKKR